MAVLIPDGVRGFLFLILGLGALYVAARFIFHAYFKSKKEFIQKMTKEFDNEEE